MAGRGYKKRSRKTNTRIRKPPTSSAGRSLFVCGGVLADWSQTSSTRKGRNPNDRKGKTKSASRSGKSDQRKGSGSRSESQKPRRNAFGYACPVADYQEDSFPNEGNKPGHNLDVSHPIVLVDSKDTQIIAYVDQAPSKEPQYSEFNYDYSTSFALDDSSHSGLGFCDEVEATPSGIGSSLQMEEKEGSCFDSSYSEEEMDADVCYTHEVSTQAIDDLLAQTPSSEKNSGFLYVGGMKLYTQDISDGEDNEDDGVELIDVRSLETSCSGESTGSSDGDFSDNTSDSDSDIDDEVAEDYFEGIGGSDEFVHMKQFLGQALDVSDDDKTSGGRFHEAWEKLGEIALQDTSREYGMMKPRARRKYRAEASRPRTTGYAWSSVLDNLMLEKDPTTISSRKKHVARLPRSWPFQAQKSKNFRKFPGEKKKYRKEKSALKRRERIVHHGVDLQQINLKLQQMVLDGVDLFSFQPMHSRDCSQVQRLAAIYRLHSGCQVAGKKSIVTVMRTEHTHMPSSSYKLWLEKLIGADDEDADFTVNRVKLKGNRNRVKKTAKGSGSSSLEILQSAPSKKKRGGKTGSYAAQPVSFVPGGTMQSDTTEIWTIDSNYRDTNTCQENQGMGSSSKYGAFELHTTGFGSKMMAKMGFVEGGGLGKDGQGIAQPIKAIQRPKSLGLGAEASETSSNSSKTKPKKFGKDKTQRFADFENHTKGFGSKMMAKMGFVEGMGLGQDSQGIVNPLVAVKLPKSRGLGAKG
ncbi:uncharacterized protein LOC114273206 [Camellia sinensis]|uniref:G-patch domain-containing protein n=1 Tax=Camellia sinensis var. sinensis TaxID=542762 RepID=A0A4S4EEH5_CAMSN|nr:uncharacterized protein LOC114273206 [Camellia sinensis]THG14125.1 hypothetical protein TEA_002735 [Camellia sinensis var. sinensis]